MRRGLLLLFIGLLVFGIVTDSMSTEYRMGALREEVMPSWILPSPPIELLNPNQELDEACENLSGLPPVGNQAQQGSCTAWATGYYYLTYLQWQEHQWDTSDPAHQASPAFIYNMINGGVDHGSHPSDAFLLFEMMGAGTMADMPYTDANFTRYPEENTFINGMINRTMQSYSINVQNQAGIQELKNHLMNGNIAATAMTVWDNFQNIGNFDYNYCVNDIYGTDPGGHAVTFIGFDDNRETSDGTGAFRLVNSWGASWGDDGYFWMSYEAVMSHQIGWGYALYAGDRIDYEPQTIAVVHMDHTDRYSLFMRAGVGSDNNPVIQQDWFDFNSGSRADLDFQGKPVVLDLTDMSSYIDDEDPTEMYVRVVDQNRYDGHAGEATHFEVRDLSTGHIAISQSTPAVIPDNNSGVTIPVTFYYGAVPPINVESEIDLSDGSVIIDWTAGSDAADFVQYVVFRDGQQIGTTTETQYVDDLDEFGIYTYSIVAEFEPCPSWHSETTSVDYVEPVVPDHLQMLEVNGETGEFLLGWEQLRYEMISYDDGTYEANVCPMPNAAPGTVLAQRFTVEGPGKVVQVGAFFDNDEDYEMGEVSYILYYDSMSGEPGVVFYQTDSFVPNAGEWNWISLDTARMPINHDGSVHFWVGVSWHDVNRSPLARDVNGPAERHTAFQVDGENWIMSASVGHPLIHAKYGMNESFAGITGLNGFDVYMDDDLIGHTGSDVREIAGTMPASGDYSFRVEATYEQGNWVSDNYLYNWDGGWLNVEETTLPSEWVIGAPYPNPFNPQTKVSITLPSSSHLRVAVYNMLGQQVALLADDQFGAGSHLLSFDGSSLASGVYFIRSEIPGQISKNSKVLLLK